MDITPFDWGARYDSPTFDSQPALAKAIDYAANITTSKEGPWCEVNLAGRELMIATPISLVSQHKVAIVNGRLTALPGLGSAPIITLGDGTPEGTPQFCNLRNVDIECSHSSNGILINGATGQHFVSVRVHGMVDYGFRSIFNSGAGVYERMNIQQWTQSEPGWNTVAARTAMGIDVGKADDIFIGCIASYCGVPLNMSAGPTQFVGCHFFNGATMDGVNNIIIRKQGVTDTAHGTTQFGSCYMDNGVIQLFDNFRIIFDGCIFIKSTGGNMTSFFDLNTSSPNDDASGFGVVSSEFRFGSLSDGIVKYSTTGGSWKPDKKITWQGNRRGDTTDVPYALAQWQDAGVIDDQRRFVLGRTQSRSLATMQPQIQNVGATEAQSSYAALAAMPSAVGPHVALGKSRGDGQGTFSPILSQDRIGTIDFFGDDGVNLDTVGALIKARAAADWGPSEHSTELIITTRSGSGGLVDRLVIDGVLRPASDNQLSLGVISQRWTEVYGIAFRVGNGNAQWLSGNGSPEGVVAAAVGSLYSRLNGGAATTLYVKETGAATNTGWVAK